MSIDPERTVSDIVAAHPETAPVLARFGLDACCGGKHPLAMTCRARKVDLDEVLRALDAVLRPITAEMTVRDILRAHPATAIVLARHGLMGCGGAEGPIEPIAWFARVHEVPIETLLDELNAAAAGGASSAAAAPSAGGPPAADVPAAPGATPPASPARAGRDADHLYRRFLKTAILFTLTGGTALGAWALALMAMRGRLGGIDRGVVQVHGHWQLFGWVGLFVVGVALHILPRLTGVPLPSYRAASLAFASLTTGVVLRVGQAFDPSPWRDAFLYGGAALELLGCGLFAWIVARVLGGVAGPLLPWQRFLGWGTAGLVASALLNAAHARDLAASGRFEVSAWLNVPYLTLFLVGFVTFWILGVSLRTLPVFMGLRARPALAGALATPLALAVASLTVSEALFLRTGGDASRVAFGLSGLAVAVLLALFPVALGILAPARGEVEPGVDRRDEKFLRLGYAWLLIAGAMLAGFSVVTLRGAALDHAWVGAYRHALTVGFITTLMIGMAQRIVPIFLGVPLWSPRCREWTFWLLALGNPIRVGGQILSAVAGPAWLRFAGVSGALELGAIVLFAVNLWRTMDSAKEAGARPAAIPPIAGDTRVGDLLDAYPALLQVFVSSGFAALANPVLRRTVARGVSVAQACRMHGMAVEPFLDRLRHAAGSRVA